MKTAFIANRLYTPVEEIQNPLLIVEDGRIQISSRAANENPGHTSVVDFGDAVLAPGFVDIHIHGGAGLDLMRRSCRTAAAGQVSGDSRSDRILSRLLSRRRSMRHAHSLGRLADAIETPQTTPQQRSRAGAAIGHSSGGTIS